MTRKIALSLILLATPALGGCVAQAALAAAQLAQYVPEPDRPSNAHLKPVAVQACTQQAARYGTVHVVDTGHLRADRMVIGGSVTDAQQRRRTWECIFTTKVESFRVREIGQP
jgi:hypothetical protein